MTSPIAIIGNAPAEDAALLRATAAQLGVGIAEEYKGEEAAAFAAEKKLGGIVSFLPCASLGLNNLLDVKGGEAHRVSRIPLFQCIEVGAVPPSIAELPVIGVFTSPLSAATAWTMLRMIVINQQLLERDKELVGEIIKCQRQKNLLVEAGTALSRENDLNRLLEVILQVSRDIAGADAGSVYIRERTSPGGPFGSTLRFKVAQNDSVKIGRIAEFRVPVDVNSIAGYVAHTGQSLKIDDVNRISEEMPYRTGRDYQKKLNYPVKSMLTLPLKNKDGEVVGVLQLMNKKRERTAKIDSPERCGASVVPFSFSDEEFIQSVASQAAVSIERAQLYENIRELFEGFLNSSMAAIDERDRVTSGHSKRVMGYAMAFADAAAADPGCPFAELGTSVDRKRQFQFAALLHDIGKIGVPERVLTKDSRLTKSEFALVLARLDYAAMVLRRSPRNMPWKSEDELRDDRSFLERINIAGRITDEELKRLEAIREKRYPVADGRKAPVLDEDEFKALSVRAGNLTPDERELINSHAVSTYRILSKIPWTRQLAMIPEIAATHHEKIDGSGYPRGIRGSAISLESKILAVVDIYEALVAQDRPYKPKMAPEKALQILKDEVGRGHLDPDVVRFFEEKGIYKLYTDLAKK